ncbi:hypothetical protein C8R46DRAFT_1214983 [Mycena filopes]|nr:hypothetical protein C8R46DRAFT_1214983 [Mycena filopes]
MTTITPETTASVLEVLHRHLVEMPASSPSPGLLSRSQLPAALLFELCSSLAPKSTSYTSILPRVLATLRDWRLLPEDERVSCVTLEDLAADLAALCTPPTPTFSSRAMVPLIWIPEPALHDEPRRTRGARHNPSGSKDAENTAPTHMKPEAQVPVQDIHTNPRPDLTHPPTIRDLPQPSTAAASLAKSRSAHALTPSALSQQHVKPAPWPLPQPGTVILRKPRRVSSCLDQVTLPQPTSAAISVAFSRSASVRNLILADNNFNICGI